MDIFDVVASCAKGASGAIYDAAKSTVNNALKSSENAVGEMKDMASDLNTMMIYFKYYR